MTDDYDPSLDSYLSYFVAIEAMRVAYAKAQRMKTDEKTDNQSTIDQSTKTNV